MRKGFDDAMRVPRNTIITTVAAVAIALGAGGVAVAVSGDDEERATGPAAERAKQAALKEAGGGRVLEVERADDGGPGHEVEIERPDGSAIEINVGDDGAILGTETEEADDREDDD